MIECICGNLTHRNSMCSKCGTVYDRSGNMDDEATSERVYEFIAYSTDINLFNRWRGFNDIMKGFGTPHKSMQYFRESIQTFLMKFDEEEIIAKKKEVLNSGRNYDLSERILTELGFQ